MADKRISDLSAAPTLTVSDLALAEVTAGSRKVRRGVEGTAVGTAFGTPTTGDRLYRTDRGIEYYYDGTRWLSTQLFHVVLDWSTISIPATVGYLPVPFLDLYSIYITEFQGTFYQDATSSWSVILKYVNSAASASTVSTITATGHVTAWQNYANTINAALSANAVALELTSSRDSGSGSLFGGTLVRYRLIG